MRYLLNKPGELYIRVFRDGWLEVYDFQRHKLLNHVYKLTEISLSLSSWHWGLYRLRVIDPNHRTLRLDLGPLHFWIEAVRQRPRPDDPEKLFEYSE